MFVESHIEKHLRQQVTHKQSISTGLFEAYQIILDNGEKVFIKAQTKANQQLISEGKELALLGQSIHANSI
jgi:fructosamine-3-kinase